jgi:hypothetical protein
MFMNPWKVFETGPPPLRTAALNSGALTLSMLDAPPSALLNTAGANTHRVTFDAYLGKEPSASARLAVHR